jgi:predicted deacetylase
MRVLQLFNTKQVPLTIAMVPCDSCENIITPPITTNSQYIAAIQQDNIELALHGLTHQHINGAGEFGRLDSAEALRRITKGKQALQAIFDKPITTFIPPFNAWNNHTLTAMHLNGMNTISADMFTPIYADSVHYFPETLGYLMAKKGMWRAAEEAIFECKQQDAVCVVMFHAYDLPDEQSWQQLESLLDACKANENVQCHTYQSLLASGIESSATRYHANQLHSGLQKYCLHEGVLHTTWLCWLVHVLNALIYALLPLVLLVGYYRRKQPLWLVAAITGCLVFGGLALWQLMGPMKLLAVDLVYVATVWVILWIISKLRCKK